MILAPFGTAAPSASYPFPQGANVDTVNPAAAGGSGPPPPTPQYYASTFIFHKGKIVMVGSIPTS